MKFVSVREAKTRFSACLDDSQQEGIVVTNHGKPKSVVIGVEGYDAADVMLMLDPTFWRMIEARRKQPRTALDDFERELAGDVKRPSRRRPRTKKAG